VNHPDRHLHCGVRACRIPECAARRSAADRGVRRESGYGDERRRRGRDYHRVRGIAARGYDGDSHFNGADARATGGPPHVAGWVPLLQLRFDLYNDLNKGTVLTRILQSGDSYLRPSTILFPRILQVGATFNF
jgi:hypothetical protein